MNKYFVDDDKYKKIVRIIKDYVHKKHKRKPQTEYELDLQRDKKKKLEHLMSHLEPSIDITSHINQTPGTPTQDSKTEKAVIEYIEELDRLSADLQYTIIKIIQLNKRLIYLDVELLRTEMMFRQAGYTDEDYRLLEEKFSNHRSNIAIGFIMHRSPNAIRYMFRKAVYNLNEHMGNE